MRSPREAERRLCRPEDELTGRQSSDRYSGAAPTIQCRTRRAILNRMRSPIGSQWSSLRMAAETQQWRLNSANFAASSGRWLSTAGAHLPQHLLLVVSTTAKVSYTVSRKEKFSDFEWFWTLLRDSTLVRGSSATSPLSSVMYSTGSLYNTKAATKSPYWLGTVYTASVRPISVTFVLRWLQPLDEPTCVQRRVAIFWSIKHEQNWANGVSVYPHRRYGTRSLIRSSILQQAANIFGKNWKHACLGKPTRTPASENYWGVNLLTYLLGTWCDSNLPLWRGPEIEIGGNFIFPLIPILSNSL